MMKLNTSAKTHIIISEACANNLKKLSVTIARDALVVITGVSGSGKTSLLLDTLYAEGRRRYVESLSTYARQFLGRLQKPPVASITGVSPAIALTQQPAAKNPHATVGTSTEIYDYLKLLYARIGRTYSPISGKLVRKDTQVHVWEYIQSLPATGRVCIVSPIQADARDSAQLLRMLRAQGYTRIWTKNAIQSIDTLLELPQLPAPAQMQLVIDRITPQSSDEHHRARVMDSIQSAFSQSRGICGVLLLPSSGEDSKDRPTRRTPKLRMFSNAFALDGMTFQEPTLSLFSFNNPHGACPKCHGHGTTLGIDPGLVIPDANLSIAQGAVAPFRSPSMRRWQQQLLKISTQIDLPTDRPYASLSETQQAILWQGHGNYGGVEGFFKYIESKKRKVQYRVLHARYRSIITCPKCRGARLSFEALYVRVQKQPITHWLSIPLETLLGQTNKWRFHSMDAQIAKTPLAEIQARLRYLTQVGLGYLTLDRLTYSLSGGEFQRLQLASILGRPLVGAMYLLDEPTVGLHPRDVQRLLKVIMGLRESKSPVMMIEHEELIMRAADQILDIGPGAGTQGGQLVFQGDIAQLKQAKNSLTADYLVGRKTIPIPSQPRKPRGWLSMRAITQHNLRNVSIDLPLGVACAVTGVSGSGKSTLVQDVLYPALNEVLSSEKRLSSTAEELHLSGDLNLIQGVEVLSQRPIGRSSRGNPVTYVKAYDVIRKLFAQQPASIAQGLSPAHFSFNLKGGRCEACEGQGQVVVEMQFMADVHFVCEHCAGKRFVKEVLAIRYQDKNIADVLEMTIQDALVFFEKTPAVIERLHVLNQVGLGYMRMGQSLSTLSGGEAQRIKIASFLSKKNLAPSMAGKPLLFILDEPTTGLHFYDIQVLLNALYALIDQGHSLLIVEHNMELIKCMDHVIDLGPEGGAKGGQITYAGTPQGLAHTPDNHTGRYLKKYFKHIPITS